MMKPRSVIIGFRSTREFHAAWGTAAEFARLFGVSVRGCLGQEPVLQEICDLPACFLPKPLTRGAGTQHRQTMIAAVRREAEHLRASLETHARETRIETEMTVLAGRLHEGIGGAASAGDLLVVPLDLSDRPISRQIRENLTLFPALGGLLFVPSARPSRMGEVLCVADVEGSRIVDIATRIAAGLNAPLALAAFAPAPEGREAAAGGTGHEDDRFRRIGIAGDAMLERAVISPAGLRLIVCDVQDLGHVALDGPESVLLESRAALLVLRGEGDSQ